MNIKLVFIGSSVVILVVFTVTLAACLMDSIGAGFPIPIGFLIASFAAVVALIVVAVWAIPVHLLLQRFGFSNVGWYLLTAIIPSFTFIYGLKPFGNDKPIELLMQASFCSLAGGLGAVAFWYILVYRQRVKNYSV